MGVNMLRCDKWEKGDIEITDGTLDIRALSTGIVIGTGDLTMSGGDLQITLSGKIGEQRAYRDIYSYGKVEFAETGIIVGCGNVLMSGGNARIDGRQGVTIGKGYLFSPRSKKGEKVGGVFTMEGGTLECTGPEAGISVVGPGTGFDEEGNGSLWWDDDYEEVNAIVIRGGTLRTDGDGVHYAISTIAAGILIEGGTVETTLIGTIGGSVTIKDGEVTVINPQERAYAPGIYLDKLGNVVRHFRMSGGTLTVESKDCGVCLSHPGQRAEITGGTLRATGTSMGAIYAETLYVGNKMTITTPQGGKVSDVTVYPDNFRGITAQGSTVIAKEVVIEQTQ